MPARDPASIEGLRPDDAFPVMSWLGPYPAVVVDTKDPDRLGRIKARAPQVWGDPENEDEFVPDADLPWARPQFPTHDLHVPDVGDGVVLQFWGGSASEPVWAGQYLGTGDAPDEFVSSYTPEPKTRILRTSNGHSVEMRWVEGEERIAIKTAAGILLQMDDPTTAVGPKLTLKTTDQKSIELDGKTGAINITAPTGQVNVLASAGAVNVTGQGINLTSTSTAPTTVVGGGTISSNFTGAATYLFGGTLALTVSGALAVTLGAVTLGAVLTLIGTVAIGTAVTKYRLANERLFLLLEDILHVQVMHTHPVTTAPGNTGMSNLSTVTQIGAAPRPSGGLTNVPSGNIVGDVNAMTSQELTAS